MNKLKTIKTKWDLTPLFKGDNDPKIKRKRKELIKESYKFINKWKKRVDYLKDPKVLKRALEEYEHWKRSYGPGGDEAYYFYLRTLQDQLDPKLKAKFNQIDEVAVKIQNDIQFFRLRLAKIPKRLQKKFLKHKGLKEYEHFLKRLFREAKYLLNEEEEKILNLKNQTSYENWIKMVSGLLSKEERKVILETGKRGLRTFAEIGKLLDNPNKKVRISAAKAFDSIVKKHLDIAEQEINSILANKKIDDELRKMPRPDLARHIADDIKSKIVDTIMDCITSRFDIPHRFYELKAKLFRVRKLKYYEKNIEYGKVKKKKYPFGKTLNLIYKVFAGLDKTFTEILLKFMETGQIDIYPHKGKYPFSCCIVPNTISQPTCILLNHTGILDDVRVAAHELGHGIHHHLSNTNNNALNAETTLSTGEVASTFMEDFVLQEIIKKADDEERLSIMLKKLNNDVNQIFRQVAFYLFEQEVHKEFRKKSYLSKKTIGEIFLEHVSAYTGRFIHFPAGTENWWIHIPHFRDFFYVYSYVSGNLISKSLQSSVRSNPQSIKKVIDFLKAGSSDSPKNIFLKLDIDITNKKFWDKGLDEVENLLDETEMLAKKLGKI